MTDEKRQKVTIYNGVTWGWHYDYFSLDEPPNNPPPDDPPDDPPPNCPSNCCSCELGLRYSQNALVAESITSFDESSNPIFTDAKVQQQSDTTTSIPEPTSALGVLAVGLWAGLSWQKKAKRAVDQDEQS